MNKRVLALLLASACCWSATAEDLTTNDGTTYADIQITEVTPIGINFISNNNACWVDFRDLPQEIALRYGYDPVKAQQFESMLAQNQGSTINPNAPVAIPETSTVPPEATSVISQEAATANYVPVVAGTPLSPVMTPPPGSTVIVVGSLSQVAYDSRLVECINAGPNSVSWVYWNNCYYPAYWWSYWYWSHRYVSYGGRYYPARYYQHHGVWDRGHFYQYRPSPRIDTRPVRRDHDYRPGGTYAPPPYVRTKTVVPVDKRTIQINTVTPVDNRNYYDVRHGQRGDKINIRQQDGSTTQVRFSNQNRTIESIKTTVPNDTRTVQIKTVTPEDNRNHDSHRGQRRDNINVRQQDRGTVPVKIQTQTRTDSAPRNVPAASPVQRPAPVQIQRTPPAPVQVQRTAPTAVQVQRPAAGAVTPAARPNFDARQIQRTGNVPTGAVNADGSTVNGRGGERRGGR